MQMPDPSMLFGVALLLVVLLLGLGAVARQGALVLAAFLGALLVEYVWLDQQSADTGSLAGLAWYSVFAAVFLGFPFALRGKVLDLQLPWAVAALSLPLHFFLLHHDVVRYWPNNIPAVLPALCALPPLAGLVMLIRWIPGDAPFRLNRLAWFGASALFFITLIFPLQFSRQWITVGWALEGMALLWLFHRVPHPGLRVAGVGLLGATFVRLVCNPLVFDYAARGERPVFNWILYTYGIAAMCCFVGARLLAPPRNRVLGLPAPGLLVTIGTILAFALVNLEIADYFTAAGMRMRLRVLDSGNLAGDMSYTIGWSVFAFVVLIAGIVKRVQPARIAAGVLLAVAAVKLLVRDLWDLPTGYKIGAGLAVGLVALAAAFVYQQFFGRAKQTPSPPDVPPPPPPPLQP